MAGSRPMLTLTTSSSRKATRSAPGKSSPRLALPAGLASRSCISSCAAARSRSIPRSFSILRAARPPGRRSRRGKRLIQLLPQPSGQILDVLPGDAARARAAGDRPLIGLGLEPVLGDLQPVMRGIAADDGVIGVLIDVVEAEP